jgi:hypothetical protein
VEPTTDIFTLFRDLNVFVRDKKRFELKVMAPQRLWVKPQEDLKLLWSTLRVSLEVEC